MKPRNPNSNSSFNNINAGYTNIGTSFTDTENKSWESLKTSSGPLTEPILKPFNIASTALTPWISMISNSYLGKAYTAFKILDVLSNRVKSFSECFDSSKREDFNRKSVAYSYLKYKKTGGS